MPLLRAGLMSAGVRTPYFAGILGVGSFADLALDSSSNIYAVNSFFANGFTKFNSSRGTFDSYRNIFMSSGSTQPTWTGITADASQNTYLIGNAFVTSPSSQTKGIFQANNSSGATTATKEILGARTSLPLVNTGKATIDSTGAIIGAFTSDDNTNSNDSGYVIKLTNAGAITWQRKIVDLVGFRNVTCQAVATDSSNNVYAVMTYGTFGSHIVKWNSSGTIQWQRRIETNSCLLSAITVDSSANVYVAGKFTASGNVHGFVAKYNTSGTIQWQRSYVDTNTSGSQDTTFSEVAVDSSANVYLVGKLKNTSGGFTLPVVKYDTSGTLQWQRNITDGTAAASQNTYATSIKISGTSMIITGAIEGDATYGSCFITVLPTDGTKTGTYVISDIGYPYSGASTMVYTSASYTSATATQTDAAGNGTEGVGLVTIQNLSTQTMNNNSATPTYPYKQVFI